MSFVSENDGDPSAVPAGQKPSELICTSAIPGLTLQDVTFQYQSRKVVSDISLNLPAGAFLTILGPSGCGKTTLLKLIGGYLTPIKGTISYQGQDLTHLSPNLRNIGMVFQSYALFPHMTVRQNVAFGLEVRQQSKSEVAKAVEETLQCVGLELTLQHRYPAQLSGGQQQRVALARALAFSPSLLLLDEPMANLDRYLREKLRLELRQLQQQSKVTTVMVTHDQEEAMAISDLIGVMQEGRLVQIDSPRVLYNQPRTPFVAKFLGAANVIKGSVLGLQSNAFFLLRPEQIPHGGTRSGRVISVSFHGSALTALITSPEGELTVRCPPEIRLKAGDLFPFELPEHLAWRIPEPDTDECE